MNNKSTLHKYTSNIKPLHIKTKEKTIQSAKIRKGLKRKFPGAKERMSRKKGTEIRI